MAKTQGGNRPAPCNVKKLNQPGTHNSQLETRADQESASKLEATPMQLSYTVNPYIPVTHQRHLVYALVEVDPGDTPIEAPTPVNLGLVVDASRSMSIPILTEAQFNELAARGMARKKTVDGVQVGCFPDLYAALSGNPPDQVISL